jgi:23S rRNA (pseudouridine1915-N3)-methyltransferase
MPRAIGHLTVAAVGRLREPHWQAAQDEYARRLRRYTDFQLVEVKDVVGRALPDTAAAAREGEALLAAAPRGARLVLMTATGRQHSSPELAAWLQTQLEQVGTLAFLIGGPVGFDPATIAAAHEQLGPLPSDTAPRTRPRRAAGAALSGVYDHSRGAVPQIISKPSAVFSLD